MLLKQTESFAWTSECNAAFVGLENALCEAPVLALQHWGLTKALSRSGGPDLDRPFEVICDACGVGLGAVLMQDGRPTAFEGKCMSPAEQKYGLGEQELLAVIHALELWRCYLDGTEFAVVTDHSPNTFFATKTLLSPRQTRWDERLSRFQFTWEYRPGRINVADPISRDPSHVATMVLAVVRAEPFNMVATAGHTTPQLAAVRRSSTAGNKAANANIEAEDAAAAQADQDLLSQIIQGYTTDPWFEKGSNTAWLDVHKGLYY